MANIKYCRTVSTNNWYVYGFTYIKEDNKWMNAIYCYDHSKVFKKRNAMYLIEADEEIKKLLFSKNISDKTVAISILQEELKKGKILIEL